MGAGLFEVRVSYSPLFGKKGQLVIMSIFLKLHALFQLLNARPYSTNLFTALPDNL